MSAESESESDSRTVKARVSDPELLAALREAEGESTMAEVVRSSLRAELLEATEGPREESDVSPDARRGLRALRRQAGQSGELTVDTAKAVVSNDLNIPKDTVRATVFEPLRQEGFIRVVPRIQAAYIVLPARGERE